MAYASWSVVFGEQPSAAKWNILGTNDASFNDGTGIADDKILARHIDWASTGADAGIWWEELGRTTLGVAGDTISVTPISSRKYLKVLIYVQATGGNIITNVQFNGDSGNNYAYRRELDGAADATVTSTNGIQLNNATQANPMFSTMEIENVLASEKLAICSTINRFTAGAAAAPSRAQVVGKWANTAAAITRVDVLNSSTGDYAIGSGVVVLGHD